MRRHLSVALSPVALSLFALLLMVVGCRKEPANKPKVGVVPKGANHLFWQTVHAGAVKAGREFNLDIEWNAPPLEIDSSRQISIVESMVNRNLAGIVLAPVDRKALVNVVERAAARNIPVAIFDSEIDTQKRISYVASDNREGGRMAARQLGELMLGKGKVAYVGFMPGSAATMDREEGFEKELAQKFPEIKIVQKVYGKASQATAMAAVENVLSAHPDLTGIFADNESSSMGAALALKARAETKVRLVAFDANEQLIEDLRHRHVDALLVQDPMKMGYEATRAIALKLRGEPPPSRVDCGVTLVTRAEMERPEIIPLLFPDVKRWLGANAGTTDTK
jgi:ribose transport system substrate-binding protein